MWFNNYFLVGYIGGQVKLVQNKHRLPLVQVIMAG